MNPPYAVANDDPITTALTQLAEIDASQQRQAHEMCDFLRLLEANTATGADMYYAHAYELEQRITEVQS